MGFKNDLFLNIDPRFQCDICIDIVKDPQACSQCDALFCLECIEQLRSSVLFQNQQSCPHCKGKFEAVKTNKTLYQIYLNHKVKCLECNKQMNLEEYITHEFQCSKSQCPNRGCTAMLAKSELEMHENEQCDYVSAICENPGCNHFVLKNELQEHMYKLSRMQNIANQKRARRTFDNMRII